MPDISRGLGSAGDFGHNANEPIVSDGENAWTDGPPQNQGNIRRIEDELGAINQEILGPEPQDEAPEWYEANEGEGPENPFEGAEVGEYLGSMANDGQLEDFLARLGRPEYFIAPIELCALVEKEIMSVDEARAYLAGQGVGLG